MAAKVSDQDLDSILDDALEAFDHPTPTTVEDAEDAPAISAPLPHATREEGASRPVDDDDAGRALEDALRALGDLGVNPDADSAGASAGLDANVNDNDMKLVEEFVTSLGESLSGLGAADLLGTAVSAASSDGPAGAQGAGEVPVVEKLVESIVGHLLSEDVLKGPMLQMRDAYRKWLPAHVSHLSASDATRYARQQELVEQICDKYEQDVGVTEIMELLSFMQDTGAPPDEVMNQLSSDGALDGIMERLSGLDMKKPT